MDINLGPIVSVQEEEQDSTDPDYDNGVTFDGHILVLTCRRCLGAVANVEGVKAAHLVWHKDLHDATSKAHHHGRYA